MEEKLSPEERLLRLIRGKGRRHAEPSKSQPPPGLPVEETEKKAKLARIRVSSLEPELEAEAKAKAKAIWQRQASLGVAIRNFALRWIERYGSIKSINQVLFILLLISLVYVGLELVIVKPHRFQLPDSTSRDMEDIEKRKEELASNLKPYSYYSKEIEKRELFNLWETREPSSSAEISDLDETLTNLNLIGIVSGTNPQAIIEEKRTNKTYFLNRGDYIGQFKLEEILPGKVILTYNGQRCELNL